MTTTKTKTKTATKTTSGTEYEYGLLMEGVVLDIKIQGMEQAVAFTESTLGTLKSTLKDMPEARARLEQYNRVGNVRESWMLPPPLSSDER